MCIIWLLDCQGRRLHNSRGVYRVVYFILGASEGCICKIISTTLVHHTHIILGATTVYFTILRTSTYTVVVFVILGASQGCQIHMKTDASRLLTSISKILEDLFQSSPYSVSIYFLLALAWRCADPSAKDIYYFDWTWQSNLIIFSNCD